MRVCIKSMIKNMNIAVDCYIGSSYRFAHKCYRNIL
jgi:hypothetical protein